MGATSLLKVSGRFASCACAPSGAARTIERHELAPRAIIASSFYTDLRLSVRPTAVISEISGGLTRAVIHHDLKDVFARLAEACGGNSPPVDKLRFGLSEYDGRAVTTARDRKSTRLNSSHVRISYAVFCLKKKITKAGGLWGINIPMPWGF